jgi:hypothetical protein
MVSDIAASDIFESFHQDTYHFNPSHWLSRSAVAETFPENQNDEDQEDEGPGFLASSATGTLICLLFHTAAQYHTTLRGKRSLAYLGPIWRRQYSGDCRLEMLKV